MTLSIVLVLFMLMATGGGPGRCRRRKQVVERARIEEEFLSNESTASEYASEDPTDKGKGKAPEISKRRKSAFSPPRRSTGGPIIREPSSAAWHAIGEEQVEVVSTKRHKTYASKACLAERYVKFNELKREVPEFAHLLQRAPIEPVGRIPARAPFCVEVIREFYMCGKVTNEDVETGTYRFETSVRGTRVVVTPQDIGDIFGISASTAGLSYTQGAIRISTHWRIVTDAICKPGTYTNRLYVDSKELKPEYHILSLVICYNIVPTIGTKRIRWDRLLLLYLLGHPEHAQGLNVSIPFLMWHRMAGVIHASGLRELLPFPILITRILEARGVDITCNQYNYGLGPIDGVTLTKSISVLKPYQQVNGCPLAPSTSAPSTSARPTEREGLSSSQGAVTIESLHHELKSMKKRIEREFKAMEDHFEKLEDGVKKILEIIGR